MTDLSTTIQPKSDQLNADDLMSGPFTIKITNVSSCGGEQPIAINFEGDDGRPYKPCKSMRRVLVQIWGADGKSYIGRRMTLYRDPDVTYGGIKVGGIRISHMSGIKSKQQLMLTASKQSRKQYTVMPLADEQKPQHAPDPDLKKQGDEAAAKGTVAFNEWRSSLTEEQKAPLKQYAKDWTETAKQVDESMFEPKENNEEPAL